MQQINGDQYTLCSGSPCESVCGGCSYYPWEKEHWRYEEVIISRLLIKAMPRTGTETIVKFNRDLCKKIEEINL